MINVNPPIHPDYCVMLNNYTSTINFSSIFCTLYEAYDSYRKIPLLSPHGFKPPQI